MVSIPRDNFAVISIGIIVGSTRPERKGEAVARWVYEVSKKRGDAEFELVDIRDFNLPFFDEPLSPFAKALLQREYTQVHTKEWAARIAPLDGYVFVTPEYNHSVPAALKNALDFLYTEWNNKAAGFVSYGGAGGARAVEHLRLILAELQVATVRSEVNLSVHSDFENYTAFRPAPRHEAHVHSMLDQVVAWSGALKPLRMA